MMKCILGGTGIITLSLAFSVISSTFSAPSKPLITVSPEDSLYNNRIINLYQSAKLNESGLSIDVFERAITGYYNLKNDGLVSKEKSILTIADFDKNSTEKRLWIIDLDKKRLVLNTWVAHGQRSGSDKATRFSNTNDSNQSSLGFYVTGEIYRGQHGRSLRLDGMDQGFNSNARKRSIVVHGADYVSQGTINALGRLGRSQGCPAVPYDLADSVINAIEGKTVLFINVSDHYYTSKYLNERIAANYCNSQQLDTSATHENFPDTSFKI